MPLPCVGDEAAPGTRRLEHPSRRREPDVGHGIARDVQDGERARVEGVVLARVDVPDVPHVRRHRLVLPAVAADEETAVGKPRRRVEEERFDAPLTVRQAVAEEGKVGREALLRRHWEMGRRIEPVVDRHAAPGPEAFVAGDDGRSAAIGEDDVERRHRPMQRMIGAAAQLGERRRRVDIPEDAHRLRARRGNETIEEDVVEHSDAARFDHDLGRCRLGDHPPHRFLGRRIDAGFGPVRRIDVAMLLAVESVGLIEDDAMAAPGEIAEEPSVIGRRAVPVGGHEARAIEGDLHANISAREAARMRLTIARSSSARWAQLCRSLIVSRPLAMSAARSAGSSRSAARWRSIAASSCATR